MLGISCLIGFNIFRYLPSYYSIITQSALLGISTTEIQTQKEIKTQSKQKYQQKHTQIYLQQPQESKIGS